MAKVIHIDKLLEYMEETEKQHADNLAACWVSLKLTLDVLLEEEDKNVYMETGSKSGE